MLRYLGNIDDVLAKSWFKEAEFYFKGNLIKSKITFQKQYTPLQINI